MIKRISTIATMCLLSILYQVPVFGNELINHPSIKDTYLDQKYPTSIFRLGWKLEVESWDASTSQAILLQYDLTSIPSSATVTRVDMSFAKHDTSWTSTSIAFQVRRNTLSWAEKTATWNTVNPLDLTLVGSATLDPTLNYPYIDNNAALKTLVQEWVTNPSVNHGVLFLPGVADGNWFAFFPKKTNPAKFLP